jgi:hypothetical protein
MGWVVTAAFFAFLFWQVRRAREKNAELAASGEIRSPLYWTGVVLAMSALGLSMYMVHLKPIPLILWLLAIALFAATLLVRRALKWRYPH